MSHGNAPLTPHGRLRLACCVVDDGWPLRRAAERFGVSVTTAQRWSRRYRTQGRAGMVDRTSRPKQCPHQLPARIEHRIMGLRVSRRASHRAGQDHFARLGDAQDPGRSRLLFTPRGPRARARTRTFAKPAITALLQPNSAQH